MKNSEILELATEELVARIGEERANLTKLKFAHAVSAIENPSRITKVRKDREHSGPNRGLDLADR